MIKMDKKYDAHKTEEKILDFWKEKEIHKKVQKKNEKGKDYYFLDGPPYTSGYVHIGTAWNKALKDCILRYKRAQGLNVWDRAGYDMHGLPVEHKVQAKLELEQKEDIQRFGIGRFIKECRKLAVDNLRLMNDDFVRLGVWMDLEDAYQSVSEDYISGVWWLIKTAHEKGRLYEGYKPIHWDYVHQSALAKHELEYETVKDKSVFLKFRIEGKENEYLVVWTTTPWTIAYNLGVMVNPELDYIKAEVDGETWVIAKGLAAPVIQAVCDKKYKIVEEFKGEKLEGTAYTHPFSDVLGNTYAEIKKDQPKVHTVVMSSEYVTLGAGTGLVHMAPGCGPEDYEVGHRNGIKAWNNLMENGKYPEEMGAFAGWHAKTDNERFIEEFEKRGCLVAATEIEHEYPFGQRSHKPVVFRAAKQWFFKVEDLKEKLIAENNEINWLPKAAYNAFNSWLENLRDNSISKQRYWGTPLPIWRNTEDDSDYIVVGSKEELEELTGKKQNDLHLPFVDEHPIEKDGKVYKRIPDVLDVWVDAGSASWNCLNFPKDKETFDRFFPADFILEGKDQIRGWFNLLSITSMLGFDKKSFKNCYMHGFVQDSEGRKMSKSLGNTILPSEVIEKYSADVLRHYMIGGANPGLDINYNFDDMKTKNRNLGILWNLHNYLIDICKTYDYNPKDGKIQVEDVEEKLMLSRLHSGIRKATDAFEAYRLNEVPGIIEDIFLELSRGYIQKVRDKIAIGAKEERETAIQIIYDSLLEVLKVLAPVAPFMTEEIYLRMKEEFDLPEESLSLYPWPRYDENLIDPELEKSFSIIEDLTQSMLNAREKCQLGVRWPVKEIIVETKDADVKKAVEEYNDVLKANVNARDITVASDCGFKKTVKPDYKALNKEFNALAPKIIAKLVSEMASVEKKISEKGEFMVKIEGTEIPLKKEHFVFETQVPDKYSGTEFRRGNVYVDKELDDSLMAEGFSRELMRRVQTVRKEEGLQKTDRINLFVDCSEKLKKGLSDNLSMIKEKVGADKIDFSELSDGTSFKIKGEEMKIKIEKV